MALGGSLNQTNKNIYKEGSTKGLLASMLDIIGIIRCKFPNHVAAKQELSLNDLIKDHLKPKKGIIHNTFYSEQVEQSVINYFRQRHGENSHSQKYNIDTLRKKIYKLENNIWKDYSIVNREYIAQKLAKIYGHACNRWFLDTVEPYTDAELLEDIFKDPCGYTSKISGKLTALSFIFFFATELPERVGCEKFLDFSIQSIIALIDKDNIEVVIEKYKEYKKENKEENKEENIVSSSFKAPKPKKSRADLPCARVHNWEKQKKESGITKKFYYVETYLKKKSLPPLKYYVKDEAYAFLKAIEISQHSALKNGLLDTARMLIDSMSDHSPLIKSLPSQGGPENKITNNSNDNNGLNVNDLDQSSKLGGEHRVEYQNYAEKESIRALYSKVLNTTTKRTEKESENWVRNHSELSCIKDDMLLQYKNLYHSLNVALEMHNQALKNAHTTKMLRYIFDFIFQYKMPLIGSIRKDGECCEDWLDFLLDYLLTRIDDLTYDDLKYLKYSFDIPSDADDLIKECVKYKLLYSDPFKNIIKILRLPFKNLKEIVTSIMNDPKNRSYCNPIQLDKREAHEWLISTMFMEQAKPDCENLASAAKIFRGLFSQHKELVINGLIPKIRVIVENYYLEQKRNQILNYNSKDYHDDGDKDSETIDNREKMENMLKNKRIFIPNDADIFMKEMIKIFSIRNCILTLALNIHSKNERPDWNIKQLITMWKVSNSAYYKPVDEKNNKKDSQRQCCMGGANQNQFFFHCSVSFRDDGYEIKFDEAHTDKKSPSFTITQL